MAGGRGVLAGHRAVRTGKDSKVGFAMQPAVMSGQLSSSAVTCMRAHHPGQHTAVVYAMHACAVLLQCSAPLCPLCSGVTGHLASSMKRQ